MQNAICIQIAFCINPPKLDDGFLVGTVDFLSGSRVVNGSLLISKRSTCTAHPQKLHGTIICIQYKGIF